MPPPRTPGTAAYDAYLKEFDKPANRKTRRNLDALSPLYTSIGTVVHSYAEASAALGTDVDPTGFADAIHPADKAIISTAGIGAGMSGGGVFDREGKLAAIHSMHLLYKAPEVTSSDLEGKNFPRTISAFTLPYLRSQPWPLSARSRPPRSSAAVGNTGWPYRWPRSCSFRRMRPRQPKKPIPFQWLPGMPFLLLSIFFTPVSAFASDVHFVILDERPYLFSPREPELKRQCLLLQEYSEFYLSRNRAPSKMDPDACGKTAPFRMEENRAKLEIPNYSYAGKVEGRLQVGPGFVVPVGEWFPVQLWARYRNLPQDGVCFNTALVESGILPEAARSSFLDSAVFFLGMKGMKELAVDGLKWSASYGPRSNSPLVKSRASWEVEGSKKADLRREMDRHIQQHFTPGSVLCVSADDRESKRDLQDAARAQAGTATAAQAPTLRSNVESLPDDYLSESKGGHCLVFLTPDLVSESNLRLPKNLVSWHIAFDANYDLLAKMDNGAGRFHYFQINQAAAAGGEWVKEQLRGSAKLRELFRLAARHRELYESLQGNPCPYSQHRDLYGAQCAAANPQALARLKEFWLTEGAAVLDHPDFAGFRAKAAKLDGTTSFRWDADHAAAEIFRSMWEARAGLEGPEGKGL